ncbi:MAG: DUF1573 domain-containing protein [Pirellulales bacterium]
MRILPIVVVSILLGSALGATMAYVSVGPSIPSSNGLAATGQASSAGSATPSPLVEVDGATFNFGTMQKGTTRSHVFRFTNRGTAPLELQAGATSCKCTMVDLSEAKLAEGDAAADQPIPPGESASVKLKWTAEVPAGPFRQTAQVITNDRRAPRIELSIEGDVTEVTGLFPTQFSFDKLRPGEIKTAVVNLVAYGDEPLTVGDTRFDPPGKAELFNVRVVPLKADELAEFKAKSGVRIELTNNPAMPLGLLDQWLVVKTNQPEWEELKIQLVGRVVGDITLHGRGWNEELGVLHLGVIDGNKGAKAKLLISTKGNQAEAIAFEVASTDPPQLEAKIGQSRLLNPGVNHTELFITIPPGTQSMNHLDTAQGEPGQIVLKCNHPQTPEVVVHVRFAVER